jgi:hypothetical protein
MKKRKILKDTMALWKNSQDKNKVPDSLLYPPSEDIYSKFHKESDINPADISKKKDSCGN